jgi:hypothetical protein
MIKPSDVEQKSVYNCPVPYQPPYSEEEMSGAQITGAIEARIDRIARALSLAGVMTNRLEELEILVYLLMDPRLDLVNKELSDWPSADSLAGFIKLTF